MELPELASLTRLDLTKFKPLSAKLKQPWKPYADEIYGKAVTSDATTTTEIVTTTCIDATETKSFEEAVKELPGSNDVIHMRIGFRHSMGNVIPAILRLSDPETIAELHVATLTFSKQNAIDWSALLDAGKIGKLTIVCSQYFQKTSPQIYDPALILFSQRNVQIAPIRSHCKILLARLSDGRTITATGSANTRSAKTQEQLELFGDPRVYDFHQKWFQETIDTKNEKEKTKIVAGRTGSLQRF